MSEYIWEIAKLDENLIQDLMKAANITRATALVLAQRNIKPEDSINFLSPKLQSLSDPYDLPGTYTAAERIWQAIRDNERILIHGDYDTDGITASALMAWILRDNGAKVDCFLPHRIDDGYGLTTDSIAKAVEDEYSLIITVDCGITSYEAIAGAKERGVDVIITDHHEPGTEEIKAYAIVDPKLPGAPAETVDLAGVGVAFKVCHAFVKYGRQHNLGAFTTDLKEILDLVALGTVADIVPLLNENRTLVKYGLETLSRQRRPGIHALCKSANIKGELHSADITFRLAPRINAAGRMGDPVESLRLLEARSIVDANNLSNSLERYNKKRQHIEEQTIVAAEEQIKSRFNTATARTLVVWDANWHPGVLGIVASNLVRRYNRPCIVLSKDANDLYTGSGRSIKNLNLVGVLNKCSSKLLRFGGHAMAAGLCLKQENLLEFCAIFEDAVISATGDSKMKASLDISGEIPFADITKDFFRELELLEPFGHSNREPVFVTYGVRIIQAEPVGQNHARGLLKDESGEVISFIAFNRTVDSFPSDTWNLVYTPQINYFAGYATPQVRILDIR